MHALTRFSMSLPIFCLLAAPAQASDFLTLKGGYQLVSPNGEFAAEVNGVGTRVDMEDDLHFDDSNGAVAEAALQLGNFRLSAGYLPLSFNGGGILNQDISFDGKIFSASTNVSSDVDVKLYDIGLTWYLINSDDSSVKFKLGPELAVKIADADVSMTDLTTGIKEQASGIIPIPTLGLRSQLSLGDMFGIIARAGYITYNGNSFLDAEVQLEFSPVPMVGIYAGYRLFDLKVDENDIFLDLQYSGPFVGLMVRF